MHIYVVLPAATKKAPRALCLVSHIPADSGKLKYSMDSFWIALDNYFQIKK